MIIHIVVPLDDQESIRLEDSAYFKIISVNCNMRGGSALFTVDTTEDTLLYYKIKYGNDAWMR